MTPPERAEKLMGALKARFSEATIRMDSPNPQAGCYVDLLVESQEFTIDCPKGGKYGLSSVPVEGFGGGSDEQFEEIEPLLERIIHLVETKSRTRPKQLGQ